MDPEGFYPTGRACSVSQYSQLRMLYVFSFLITYFLLFMFYYVCY